MSRPDWDSYFLMLAHVTATRATCDRKKVGAVIVDGDNRIVSGGYNGAPAGMPECDEVGHEMKDIDGRQSCVRTLHAESNAIDRAWRDVHGATIYCTVIPCYDCAKRIVSAGIARVVYAEYYESRNTKMVADYFAQAAVELVHLSKRFVVHMLCDHGACGNEARYDSGRCATHADEAATLLRTVRKKDTNDVA